MKRLILIALIFLSLSACATQDTGSIKHVVLNDAIYSVDYEAKTITHNDDVYHFHISSRELKLTYPNGATYSEHYSTGKYSSTTSSGWSDDYDEKRYVSGDILSDIIVTKEKRERGSMVLLGLLFLGVGVWNALWPRLSWYLSYGWRYKNAEPSELALGFNRVMGICAAVAGGVMLFI